MNPFERFRIEILRRAKNANPNTGLRIRTSELASQYGIEERYIREQLVEFHKEKVICLSAWDETRDKPIDDWRDTDLFFNFASDGFYKSVRLLLRGAEYLESLPKPQPVPESKPIGFMP